MKTTLLVIAAFLSIGVSATNAQQIKQLSPGDELPAMDVSLRNANGKSTSMKAAEKENGLLVMFSCNTCPFVIKNQPITKKVIEYAAAHHIGMVIINSNETQRDDADSYEAMQRYAKEQGYTVPYLVDQYSRLADLFGANHTPEVFLFNNKHKLVYRGAMNDDPGNPAGYKKMYIEDAVNAMMAGKEADPAVTKSIGCGIKRRA